MMEIQRSAPPLQHAYIPGILLSGMDGKSTDRQGADRAAP
jgi:hypothetical protein